MQAKSNIDPESNRIKSVNFLSMDMLLKNFDIFVPFGPVLFSTMSTSACERHRCRQYSRFNAFLYELLILMSAKRGVFLTGCDA